MWIQYDIITHEDKISFWWKDANSCEVNEDVPQGKKGEADEEAQGTKLAQMVANWVNHPFKVKRKKTKRLKVKYVEKVFDRYCYVVVEVLVMVELIHCWANLDTYHWSVLFCWDKRLDEWDMYTFWSDLD